MVPLLAWPAAILVGLSLGLLGSGGSILTVPLLHRVVGVPIRVAEATSLPIVGLVAAAALLVHARRGDVRLLRALPFAGASVCGAFASRALLAPLLSERAHVIAFAALMLVVAWRMAFGAPPREDVERPQAGVVLASASGLATGALTGLLAVGGGFAIVPALVLFLRFDVRRAVGTSLLVIALNCASSFLASRLTDPASVRWDLVALFTVAGVVGATAGGRLAHRLEPRTLRRTFAAVVVVMAGVLLASLA
jgi:uncharacterized membrane protein YfcA